MFKKSATYICILLTGIVGFFGLSITNNKLIDIGILNSYADDCTVGVDAGCTNPLSGPQNPQTVAPGTKAGESAQDQAITAMINKGIVAWNSVLALLTAIVTPAVMLASWLMSPDWTSGDLFGIRPIVHKLWITVSNITYFIYAILLIFIALATIFNSENYGYKQLLPKLALGILMVPLSWWFIQFTISLSSVVTASVMNIPTETLNAHITEKGGTPTWWTKPSIERYREITLQKNDGSTGSTLCSTATTVNDKCTSPQDMIDKSGGMYSALLIYGYGIFKIGDVKALNTVTDYAKNGLDVIHQLIFGSLVFVVFGFLILALVFMLMMRAIKLWFYAIFSPLMTLKFVLGDKIFGKEGGDSFEIKEFLGLAFVPALVGLALSFGLVIVSALQSETGNTGTTCDAERIKSANGGCELVGIMGIPDNKIIRKVDETNTSITEIIIGGVTWSYKGKITGGTDMTATQTNNVKGVISGVGGIFGTLIIDIIALVFIWVAFMAAKNVSTFVKKAVEPFENIGNKIGQFGMSLPKYAPILPGGMNVSGLGKAVQAVENSVSKMDNENFEKSKLGQMLGAEKNLPEATAQKLIAAMKNPDGNSAQIFKDNLAQLKRENAHYSEVPKAFVDKIKSISDDSEKRSFLKKLGIDNFEVQTGLLKFVTEKGDNLNDPNKKDFMNLLTSALSGAKGSSSGSADNNTGAKYYTATPKSNPSGKDVKMDLRLDEILLEVNTTTKTLTILEDQKAALKNLMASMTQEEMLSRKPSNIEDTVWKALIKEMEKDGRSFKKSSNP